MYYCLGPISRYTRDSAPVGISMKTLEQLFFRLTVVCWMFFAWLLATEVGLLSASLRGDGVAFRWQVWLLAGILVLAAHDLVSELRCRCCGSREDLSVLALFTRSRELLCRRCLRWDPGVEAEPAPAPPVRDVASG